MGDRNATVVAIIATSVVVVALIGLPLGRLTLVATERGWSTVATAFADPTAATAIANTVWISAAAAAIAVVAGTGAAIFSEALAGFRRRAVRAAILAPLLLPPFVLAQAWARAWGPSGLSDQVLGVHLPWLYGPGGIIVVLAVAATPLTYLVVAGAIASRVEPELDMAARASGAGSWTVLATVTLPLLRRAIVAAAIVAFVFAANAFGVPAVLGTPAGFLTITTRLYQDLAFSADPLAFVRATVLAATLMLLALVVVGAADAFLIPAAATRSTMPSPARDAGRPSRFSVALLVAAVLLTTLLPFVALVLTALTRAVGLPPVPEHWTVANFQAAVGGRFGDALATTLALATVAASIVLVLGAVAAVATRSRGRALGTLITLGFAVPGSALAVAVLLAYGGRLRDTLMLILIAYLAKFWALAHRQLSGSADRLPPDLVRAARASGAGPITAFRSIVAPILAPSAVAAWAIVFVFGLHELTMSSLLYGPGTATLAVVVLGVQQLGDPTVSAALAVLLTAIVVVGTIPVLLVRRAAVRPDPVVPGG